MLDCSVTAPFFARLYCHVDHNFVAWWKAASIVVTAVLGIVGLVKDFRAKKSPHQITWWGWALLAGLVVSATLGVAAQLKETHDDDVAERHRSEETLAIVQNTSNAIKLMSTLAGSTANVTYSVKCTPAQVDPCPDAASVERVLGQTKIRVYFYTNPDSAKRFTEGSNVADLEWSLYREGPVNKETFGETGGPSLPEDITVLDYKIKTLSSESVGGRIWSAGDLPGSTIFIQADAGQLDSVAVDTLKIRIKDGQSIVAGPFQRISVVPPGPFVHAPSPQTAYRYDFPMTIRPVAD